jgi:hypothetical protein
MADLQQVDWPIANAAARRAGDRAFTVRYTQPSVELMATPGR